MLTLRNAIEPYLKWKESYTIIAANRYEVRLKAFEVYIGSNTLIADIELNDVLTFHKQMEANYSKATIAFSARVLKNFFEFYRGRSIPCLNPKEIRTIHFISPDKELLSLEDFKLMNDVLDERFYEDLIRKLAINLLWDCGMRVSELIDMRIADIEETDQVGFRCARIRRRKSQRYSTVVWGVETNRLLNLYLGLRLSLDVDSDALFISRNSLNGKKITTRTVQRWVREISAMVLENRRVTPHIFRHTKANMIISKTQNVRDVQVILGHVSPVSSFHYLNVNRERAVKLSMKYL